MIIIIITHPDPFTELYLGDFRLLHGNNELLLKQGDLQSQGSDLGILPAKQNAILEFLDFFNNEIC